MQDRARRIPLHAVAVVQRSRAVATLVNLGAKKDALDLAGDTPLSLAAVNKSSVESESLSDSRTPVFLEDELEALGVLMGLISPDAWPPFNDNDQTPFTFAAEKEKSEVITRMIERAEQLGFRHDGILMTKQHETALSACVRKDMIGAVQGLVVALTKLAPQWL
ncbi:hypothetical protein ACHAPI_006185 [Fusarium lateritium]